MRSVQRFVKILTLLVFFEVIFTVAVIWHMAVSWSKLFSAAIAVILGHLLQSTILIEVLELVDHVVLGGRVAQIFHGVDVFVIFNAQVIYLVLVNHSLNHLWLELNLLFFVDMDWVLQQLGFFQALGNLVQLLFWLGGMLLYLSGLGDLLLEHIEVDIHDGVLSRLSQ